jgi:circadian clock protein KaiC
VHIERSEIQETGEYDLEGLFIRLGHAIDSIGAKRVVLDTIEALFSGLPKHAVLRAELRRLFLWMKGHGVTALITGQGGERGEVPRHCARHQRVPVPDRGQRHLGAPDYLDAARPSLARGERMSTGIGGLADMLDGLGVYRGSSTLVFGAPGIGKSSIGATFVDVAWARGERALLFACEESSSQVMRNMRSIGVDLGQWEQKGLLHIDASRPTLHGLEQNLVHMYELVRDFKPAVVVVDPISNVTLDRDDRSLEPTLMRLIDFLKQKGVGALFTGLTSDVHADVADSQVGVSSLMDTWSLLSNVAANGERRTANGERRAHAHAHAAGAEVARHAAFAPGARVHDGRSRRRPGRRLPVRRSRADRHGAHLPGGAGTGRHRPATARLLSVGSRNWRRIARRSTRRSRRSTLRRTSAGRDRIRISSARP